MAPTVFPISTVVEVSVSNPPTAVNEYNTSNLAIFTTELPAMSFGSLGYALYSSPTQVGIDFGTSSRTFQMANAIFSQNPNILLNQGQLIVILQEVATQTLTFSGIPASGATEFTWGGNSTVEESAPFTASSIQAALRTLPGLSEVTVTGSGTTYAVVMNGVYGATPSLFTLTSNTLETAGSSAVTLSTAVNSGGETIGAAITRTQGVVQYFGALSTHTLAIIGQTDLLTAAAIIQALPLMGFFGSFTSADVAPGGMIDLVRTGLFTQTRCQFYEDSSSGGINTILETASYAGRMLSVNFSGSLTTITANLKQLATINPDPNINSTVLGEAQAAGADVYINISGSPETWTSGKNQFFDNVYNQLWFSGALSVAYFNYLAQTSTKILQTEDGMTGLKDALTLVCEEAVNNGYLAPGTWNSPTTFGNITDLYNNISQFGYYIYSTPVSQQNETDRQNRVAPLVQIAVKLGGALQSGVVFVIVNQ